MNIYEFYNNNPELSTSSGLKLRSKIGRIEHMDLSSLSESLRDIFGTATSILAVLRGIGGFILVFFLPGFAWSLVFFKKLKVVERIAVSIGLSIAMVTLIIMFLNVVLGMKITLFSSIIVIIVLVVIPLAIYGTKRLMNPLKKN